MMRSWLDRLFDVLKGVCKVGVLVRFVEIMFWVLMECVVMVLSLVFI